MDTAPVTLKTRIEQDPRAWALEIENIPYQMIRLKAADIIKSGPRGKITYNCTLAMAQEALAGAEEVFGCKSIDANTTEIYINKS